MKKTILSIGTAVMMAFAITGCQQGNVEEMMKQDLEKSNSLVQTQIDALNMSLDSTCNAQIEDAANLQFQAFADSMAKVPGAKKIIVKKPKPKPGTTPVVINKGTNAKDGKMDGTTKVTTEDTKVKDSKMDNKPIEVTKEQTNKKNTKMGGGM